MVGVYGNHPPGTQRQVYGRGFIDEAYLHCEQALRADLRRLRDCPTGGELSLAGGGDHGFYLGLEEPAGVGVKDHFDVIAGLDECQVVLWERGGDERLR